MSDTSATIVPTRTAAVRPRVTPALGLAPKISDGDVENSSVGPRVIVTSLWCEPPERWPTARHRRCQCDPPFSRQADGTDDVAGAQIDALVAFLHAMQQRGAE